MVTVHGFRVWDFLNDKWVYPDHKRTAKSIKAIGAEIIEGSAEEVLEKDIDGQGRYEVTIDITEAPVVCPRCRPIRLIRIPKIVAGKEDIAICPECGAGGPYEKVVNQGGNLLSQYKTDADRIELLRRCGYKTSR